jgi:LysR family transcriptional regulator, hydrogen peroxide-inducible genes activator
MEVHQLRYFVAVAEEGSFSRAAERMRVAQPSLSQQIQKLEQEMGQRLFDRLARGVMPTVAGADLLPLARKILNELVEARRRIAEQPGTISGTVTAGIIPTIAPYILGPLLTDMGQEHPQVAVRAVEDVTENLIRLLEVGEIDVAVVSTCRSGAALRRELWTEEPLLVALPRDHRLARRRRLFWRDLSRETLLALQESHCLSRQVSQLCGRHGVRLEKALPLVQLSTVLAMVSSRQGISLVPALARSRESRSECVFLPLAGAAAMREINAVRNPARYQSRACAAFVELGQRVVRRLVASAT